MKPMDIKVPMTAVPSAAGAEFEHLVTWLKLEHVEHAKDESGLQDRGRDVLIIVAGEIRVVLA
jgi:hypothetical protein